MPVNDFFNSCEATKQSNAVPLSVLRNVEMIVDDPDGRPFAHRTQFWSCSVPDDWGNDRKNDAPHKAGVLVVRIWSGGGRQSQEVEVGFLEDSAGKGPVSPRISEPTLSRRRSVRP